jgi:hypothetical protein
MRHRRQICSSSTAARDSRRGFDVAGTPLLNQIFDVARGELCVPQRWSDGQLYCTPYEHTGYTRYADAACTQPAAVAYLGETLPTYAVRYTEGECVESAIRELLRLGARLPQSEYYALDGGSAAATASPTSRAYSRSARR